MISSKLLKNIDEVSKLIGVNKHVLRHWESRLQSIGSNILTVSKGRDGKRRYYREPDIEILKKIKYLMYVKKFTMKGVAEQLKLKSKNNVKEDLVAELKSISNNLKNLINYSN